MADCECKIDCSLVPEDEIETAILEDNDLNAGLDNYVIISRTYTGIENDLIKTTIDNNNFTIEAKSKTYIFEQAIPSATWNITHNLGKYPSVTVVDSAGEAVIITPTYIDENSLTLDFGAEFSGKAYLN